MYKEYPKHDINLVFEMLVTIFEVKDCDPNAMNETLFLNKLFAALPAIAVDDGMQFLNGKTDLPSSCDDILPLFIRFKNLVEYSEKIEILRDTSTELTNEQVMERVKISESLASHEESFGKQLLGFKANENTPNQIDPNAIAKTESNIEEADDESNQLHLMDGSAAVLVCDDIIETALFYENKCGFKAIHLDDEKLPHIRLTRDNIDIVLTKGDTLVLHKYASIDYDMYIYVNEPFLLQNELQNKGVNIVSFLPEANESVKSLTNREFVFEDNDGRLICVSQRA